MNRRCMPAITLITGLVCCIHSLPQLGSDFLDYKLYKTEAIFLSVCTTHRTFCVLLKHKHRSRRAIGRVLRPTSLPYTNCSHTELNTPFQYNLNDTLASLTPLLFSLLSPHTILIMITDQNFSGLDNL